MVDVPVSERVVLDLCGGTGAWSEPYRQAGYAVENVTWPLFDVTMYVVQLPVYGILAAPPCHDFSVSGAQYWKAKDADGRTVESMGLVLACLRIIAMAEPVFWALENPVGRLRHWMGPPRIIFDPCDFGDPYTKKTLLWGRFNMPVPRPVEPIRVCKQGSWVQQLGGKSQRTKRLRSITPPGFAQAFFEANQ